MSPDETIKRLVETLILPKYPELKLVNVDSWSVTSYRTYNVRFMVKKKLPSELQQEIDTEVKTLFKMASLDEREQGRYEKNVIMVWFKTPREKHYTFSSEIGYNH